MGLWAVPARGSMKNPEAASSLARWLASALAGAGLTGDKQGVNSSLFQIRIKAMQLIFY